jgi:uncharacterized protein YdbL (DUF1318 family)
MTTNIHYKAKTIAAVYQVHLARMIAVCAAAIAIALFLYGFFLLEAVAHTASRAEAQGSIETLTGELSALEQEYLAQTAAMTLEKAKNLGFVSPSEVAVIYADRTAHTLSVNMRY